VKTHASVASLPNRSVGNKGRVAICAGEDRQIRLAMRRLFCTIAVVVLTAPALCAENGVHPGEFIIEPPTLICLGFEPASAKATAVRRSLGEGGRRSHASVAEARPVAKVGRPLGKPGSEDQALRIGCVRTGQQRSHRVAAEARLRGSSDRQRVSRL
jgi:hypothetical protein